MNTWGFRSVLETWNSIGDTVATAFIYRLRERDRVFSVSATSVEDVNTEGSAACQQPGVARQRRGRLLLLQGLVTSALNTVSCTQVSSLTPLPLPELLNHSCQDPLQAGPGTNIHPLTPPAPGPSHNTVDQTPTPVMTLLYTSSPIQTVIASTVMYHITKTRPLGHRVMCDITCADHHTSKECRTSQLQSPRMCDIANTPRLQSLRCVTN